MATPSAPTWTFTVAVAATPSPTPVATAVATASPSAAPTRAVPATPVPSIAPTPAPSDEGSSTGSGSDALLPIIVALIILGAGAAYLLSRRNRPPEPPASPEPPGPARTARPHVIRDGLGRTTARVSGVFVRALGLALGLAVFLPATVAAHSLNATYTSRLPLAVYLVGAATTVALSFIFVIVRDVRAAPPDLAAEGSLPPAWIRYPLRAIGLLGWVWIIAQGIAGNTSDADVATLFLWVYGWVGLAMICAIVGPVWQFLDPFSTLHDLGAAVLGRLGVQGWAIADYPARIGRWPATVGFAFFVWLELVVFAGASTLFIVLVGYTALTLAMMAQFGRDEWRSQGETFTVWFRLLGRLAHWRLVDEEGRVHPRAFGSGLLEPGWSAADVTLVAFGVSSIIFDGLSQTESFFSLFGAPAILERTLLLFGFMGIVVLLAFAVAQTVGFGAIGAGLLPIAVGYLIAHYLTYLLIDGQRILIAISDPLQRGSNLFGTAFHTPSGDWLPPGLVWTIQLAAVVGGHMLGAWGGHVVAVADAPPGMSTAALRRRQVPLAVVMVCLTTLTLWSLGQAIVVAPPDGASGQVPAVARL